MAAPDNRVPVRLARGTKATLDANIADLYEGEICYATDENICYVKEGASLEPASGGATSLDQLSDVDLSTPATAGQSLVWSVADSAFIPGNPPASTLDDLTDVDTSTVAPTDGQVLTWNNTDSEWQPADASTVAGINDLTDVDTATAAPTDGQVLTWNNTDSEWQPADAGGGVPTATDLGDVITPDYVGTYTTRNIRTVAKGGAFADRFIRFNFNFEGDDYDQTKVFPSFNLENAPAGTAYPDTSDPKFGTGCLTIPDRTAGYTLFFNNPPQFDSNEGGQRGFQQDQWAIEFWYKSSDTDIDAVNTRIVFTGGGSSDHDNSDVVNIRMLPSAGTTFSPHADNAYGALALAPASAPADYIVSTRDLVLNDGNWHHVIFQHNGSGVYSCFADGARKETADLGTARVFTNDDWRIGQSTSTRCFEGSLDEIVVLFRRDIVSSGNSTYTVPTEPRTYDPYGDGLRISDLVDVGDEFGDFFPSANDVLIYNSTTASFQPGSPPSSIENSIDMDNSLPGGLFSTDNLRIRWDGERFSWEPSYTPSVLSGATHEYDSTAKTSLALTVPSTVREDNLLVVFIYSDQLPSAITAPDGWFYYTYGETSAGTYLIVYQKYATADDETNAGTKTYTWTQALSILSGSMLRCSTKSRIRSVRENTNQNTGSTHTIRTAAGLRTIVGAFWDNTSGSETFSFSTDNGGFTTLTSGSGGQPNAGFQLGHTNHFNNVTSTHLTNTGGHKAIVVELEYNQVWDMVNLNDLKAEVAASTDFADFQSRIANLGNTLTRTSPN